MKNKKKKIQKINVRREKLKKKNAEEEIKEDPHDDDVLSGRVVPDDSCWNNDIWDTDLMK